MSAITRKLLPPEASTASVAIQNLKRGNLLFGVTSGIHCGIRVLENWLINELLEQTEQLRLLGTKLI
jgi:hypothetical protein